VNEERLGEELRRQVVPGESDAAERSWEVVRAAMAERDPALVGARRRSRLAVALGAMASAGVVLAIALTPAGAEVREWMADAVDPAEVRAPADRRGLTGVPSGGRLLVGSEAGQWVVDEDGSRRLLGEYSGAAWSPSGMFVAVARERELSAVEPDGGLRWSISAPGPVADQTWAPGCCRIAYRSDGGLFVVDGAGASERRLAARVAPVRPAWMPVAYDDASRNVLAYADRDGLVHVRDVDSGEVLASAPLARRPIALSWLDRDRILVVARDLVEVVRVDGGPAQTVYRPDRGRIEAASASVDGNVAVLIGSRGSMSGSAPGRVRSSLVLVKAGAPAGDPSVRTSRTRTLFSGLGRYDSPVFSPDGQRIQLGLRDLDQWLFVSPKRGVDPIAVGDITRQFEPGGGAAAPLPRVDGWCCD